MKSFTLFSLVRIAIKHILILVVAALIFAGTAFTYCEFIATPVYTATGSVVVTNGALLTDDTDNTSRLENTDIVASMNIADTIIDILKTNDIYKALSANTGNKYDYKNLASRVTIDRKSDTTLFIDVTFSANTKEEAITLVNEFLKLSPDYIKEYVPGIDSVAMTTADSANQTYPRTIIYSLFAAVVGAGIAYAVILLIYSTNTVIRGEEDFLERFDIPVIGSIPDFATARSEKYYKSHYYNYYGKGGEGNGNQNS